MKYCICLIFLVNALVFSAQKRMSIILARGGNNVQFAYQLDENIHKQYFENSFLSRKKNRIDLQFTLTDELDFKLGFSEFLNQDRVFYHQIPIEVVFKNKIYKGLNIGIEGGFIFNRLSKQYSVSAEEYINDEFMYTTDSTQYLVREYINVPDRTRIYPVFGLQLQYKFKNGIELNYSASFMYGGNKYSQQTALYYEVDGVFQESNRTFVTNTEFWSRFSLGIPIYNFDKKIEEK